MRRLSTPDKVFRLVRRRAGNAGERHVGPIRRAAGRGLAGQRDRAGDARRQRNVGEVLMDGRLRRVGAGIDQDHLDRVGHPVDLRFEEALPGEVV